MNKVTGIKKRISAIILTSWMVSYTISTVSKDSAIKKKSFVLLSIVFII